MPGDDVLAVDTAEPCHSGFALVAYYPQRSLVGLLGVDVEDDVEHDDGAEHVLALLRHAEQLGPVRRELDAFDGRVELPGLEQFASLDIPQPDGVVGGAGGQQSCGGINIDGPDGSDVALICA
jgi:hypothetical protein